MISETAVFFTSREVAGIYLRHSSIIIHSILFPTELISISTLQHFQQTPKNRPFCTDRPPPNPSWESCRTGKSFATKGLTKSIKVIVTSQYSPCRSSLIHHVHGLSHLVVSTLSAPSPTRCLCFKVWKLDMHFQPQNMKGGWKRIFSFSKTCDFSVP